MLTSCAWWAATATAILSGDTICSNHKQGKEFIIQFKSRNNTPWLKILTLPYSSVYPTLVFPSHSQGCGSVVSFVDTLRTAAATATPYLRVGHGVGVGMLPHSQRQVLASFLGDHAHECRSPQPRDCAAQAGVEAWAGGSPHRLVLLEVHPIVNLPG